MNNELLELVKSQESQIKQLKKFIWDISENPDLLKDQTLMNILIEVDFNNSADPTLASVQECKIKQLENRLFATSELLDKSRQLINQPHLISELSTIDLECYNKAVDGHKCEWIHDNVNIKKVKKSNI